MIVALLVQPHPTASQWLYVIAALLCAVMAVIGLMQKAIIVWLTAAILLCISVGLLIGR